jgi:aerobic-type carbon monoxide dehydrogenase small subunit (CoxS/CutS family)
MAIGLRVNGVDHEVDVALDTPLLYVLRNELGLHGPKFGCGLSQCGVCSVLVNGREAKSCQMTVSNAAGLEITTVEGLPAFWAGSPGETDLPLHPVQQAWVDEQVPQCGYCQSGMMITTVSLLEANPNPSDADIRTALEGHICRCGTHMRVLRAVQRAATEIAKVG